MAFRKTGIARKEAVGMDTLIRSCLRTMGLSHGLNQHIVSNTWDKVSGSSAYTVNRFFRDGKFYVTVSSSVVRSTLLFQRDSLLERMNELLSENELFSPETEGDRYIKELIIK